MRRRLHVAVWPATDFLSKQQLYSCERVERGGRHVYVRRAKNVRIGGSRGCLAGRERGPQPGDRVRPSVLRIVARGKLLGG